ncbi:putative glutamine amidotransferase [Solibacillus kalamii]|uniref:Gamma-glutamyl-gamma-aminobutyrate hydrolase n=1 Tax=Solibacillus kalamii TaxID=1748298 RepID=A0ABX3ZKC9_9BACL|nr:gamma-glutamyl-gamma-aminobutyrate hydrolase family protein [Solibacillus kalamii]MBM7664338.1 putative glutamine amidotransferase [Solibacillus kalamii]OUZ39901.1 gamma-glutamyl-gamma-aminobutyrate hydrolase [Solibacillus kalamii]
MKPIIGLTMYDFDKKLDINNAYLTSIELAGGIPICIPNATEENVEAVLNLVDGLVLIGGADIDPLLFNEEPHRHIGSVVRKRDDSDLLLMNAAFKRQMPVLGICRGQQIMNVAFGGTIIQDIPSQVDNTILHKQPSKRGELAHTVEVKTPKFKEIFTEESFRVNTFHHQSVGKLGEGLLVSAVAKDGIIEGIEHESHPYCVAVQWHPEELAPNGDVYAQRLFKSFIEACHK